MKPAANQRLLSGIRNTSSRSPVSRATVCLSLCPKYCFASQILRPDAAAFRGLERVHADIGLALLAVRLRPFLEGHAVLEHDRALERIRGYFEVSGQFLAGELELREQFSRVPIDDLARAAPFLWKVLFLSCGHGGDLRFEDDLAEELAALHQRARLVKFRQGEHSAHAVISEPEYRGQGESRGARWCLPQWGRWGGPLGGRRSWGGEGVGGVGGVRWLGRVVGMGDEGGRWGC